VDKSTSKSDLTLTCEGSFGLSQLPGWYNQLIAPHHAVNSQIIHHVTELLNELSYLIITRHVYAKIMITANSWGDES